MFQLPSGSRRTVQSSVESRFGVQCTHSRAVGAGRHQKLRMLVGSQDTSLFFLFFLFLRDLTRPGETWRFVGPDPAHCRRKTHLTSYRATGLSFHVTSIWQSRHQPFPGTQWQQQYNVRSREKCPEHGNSIGFPG